MVHRVLTHEDNTASRYEVEHQWPLHWLVEAQMALNVKDSLRRAVAQEQRRRAEKPKRRPPT